MPNISNMNIGIGTNLGRLDAGLSQASKKITSFSKGVEKRLGSISTKRLERGLSNITTKGVPAAGQLASSMQNVQQPIQGTTSAVINFNRVIQDAPFGIIGVANNIDPLVQSFNNLRSQTGSTTGALTTLLKSAFTGPGALITVFSLASSAMLFFSMRMRGAGKAAKEANSELSDFQETLEEVARTEVGGIFEGLTNEQKLKALEDALAQFEPTEELTKSVSENWDAIVAAANEAAKNTAQLGEETSNVQGQLDALNGTATVLSEEQIKQLKQADEINEAVEEELKNRLAQARATSLIREQIEKIGIEQKKNNNFSERFLELANEARTTIQNIPPEHEVILSLDMQTPEKPFEELTADEILSDLGNIDIGEKIFPPGSLGALQERLSVLKEELKSATDPEEISRLKDAISGTKESIKDFGPEAKGAMDKANAGVNQLAGGLGRVVGALIDGKKEALSFGNIIGAILPGVLSMLGGGPFASFTSSLFGGVFHQGGTVPGALGQERLILAQGGETIRTPKQERALSKGGGKRVIQVPIYLNNRQIATATAEYEETVSR